MNTETLQTWRYPISLEQGRGLGERQGVVIGCAEGFGHILVPKDPAKGRRKSRLTV